MKLWIEVEIDKDAERVRPAMVNDLVRMCLCVPGVITAVCCQNTFPAPPAVDETTRRRREWKDE